MFQAQIFEDQDEVDSIIYDAMDLFWNDSLFQSTKDLYFPNHPLQSKMNLLEKMFLKASSLAPYRLDLRYDAAFLMVSQGKMSSAIGIYQEITSTYGRAYSAALLEAVYSKITEGNSSYEAKMSKCMEMNEQKTQDFKKVIEKAEIGLRKTNFPELPYQVKDYEKHYVVILGYVLNEDGSMKDELIHRLQKGLKMYELNPHSKLMLSGGFPKAGRTESFMMMNWLLEKGVPMKDIILEEKSKDTLGNALQCISKLKAAGVDSVTIVTSASHIRRAMLLFESVSEQKFFSANYHFLVNADADISSVSQSEQIVIFRDIVRANGIWAFPGLFK